jgi:hypothetical protein
VKKRAANKWATLLYSHPNTETSADDATESPPWMNKKLLEVWLRSQYGQVTVMDCESRLATVKGDNYLSTLHRLLVRTKGGQSHPLIAKCRMEEGLSAKILKDSSIFRKEQQMYGNTLPRMSALLKKALPGRCSGLVGGRHKGPCLLSVCWM